MYLLALVLILQTLTTALKTEKTCNQDKDSVRYQRYSPKTQYQNICSTSQTQDCQQINSHTAYTTDTRFQGRYSFPVKTLPRMNCFDPAAMKIIDKGLPIVLENCSFARTAHKWSVEYLDKNLQDKGHISYVSSQRRFLYFDEDNLVDSYKNWTPPHQKRLTYFHDFLEMAKTLKQSDNGTRSYFQSPLYVVEGVSPALEGDINSFDYSWLLDIVTRLGWGDEMINLLLIGMTDVVTPAHYDMLENFFVQISGFKRVIIFSPEYFKCLYPFPVGHPHDRQTQVNFDNPDFERFPKFREIEGLQAILGPGDVIYIPTFWWHYVESERNNMTVSLNFWFDPRNDTITTTLLDKKSRSKTQENPNNTTTENKPQPKEDFTVTEELVLKRKIESMIYETTRDHHKVLEVLKEIIAGRFAFLDAS